MKTKMPWHGFFPTLNLPIWLKRYSLQVAVGRDNIPPQMDSLKHMGNMPSRHLHPLCCYSSPCCSPLHAACKLSLPPTDPIDPTTMPHLSKELCHCYYHHGITLPSVSPVIKKREFATPRIYLPEVPTPSRSLNLKRYLNWQLQPLIYRSVSPKI